MRIKMGNVERIVSEERGKHLVKNEKAVEVIETPASIEDMKVAELKKLATKKGVENADFMKKEELLEVLKDVI